MRGRVRRRWRKFGFGVLIGLCLAAAGCSSAPRTLIGLGSDNLSAQHLDGTTIHRIFIATTRARSDNPLEFFSGERSPDLSLAHVDVSVPPNHRVGQLERSTSKSPDPQTNFVVFNPTLIETPQSFGSAIEKALLEHPAGSRDVLVFVHGYNVNFSDAVLRVAQFVHDTKYQGVPVLFSWASRGRTVDYVYDINSALQARDRLIRLGGILSGTDAEHFDIVAHSMGNLLTVEAMRQLQLQGKFNTSGRLRRIILASPDIDIDLFRTQLTVFPEKERQFYVLISEDDRALELSRRLGGGISRVGAADATKLAELGINVIDVTEISEKGSINHSKFADSPAIVQLIGRSLEQGNTLEARTDVSRAEALVGNIFKSLTLIPSAIIDGAQGSVLVVGNR